MSKDYFYTDKDLLNGDPYHYHYTQYEGMSFLNGYCNDRLHALETLNQRLKLRKANLQTSAIAVWPERKGTKDIIAEAMPLSGVFDRAIDTTQELAAVTKWVARGGNIENEELMGFVDALIKKFEVSKRLRSRYAVGLRTEVHDSAAISAYCFFAFLIAIWPSDLKSIWRMNTLLKVNDLLLSTDTTSIDTLETAALATAVRIEFTMITSIANSKGLSIK